MLLLIIIFLKVEQIIGYRNKASLTNTIRILLPTTNYIDYSIPYFTGSQWFAIYGLSSTNTFYFKNKQLLTSPAPLQQPIQMLKEFFF
jgi:hypothetical protein